MQGPQQPKSFTFAILVGFPQLGQSTMVPSSIGFDFENDFMISHKVPIPCKEKMTMAIFSNVDIA